MLLFLFVDFSRLCAPEDLLRLRFLFWEVLLSIGWFGETGERVRLCWLLAKMDGVGWSVVDEGEL